MATVGRHHCAHMYLTTVMFKQNKILILSMLLLMLPLLLASYPPAEQYCNVYIVPSDSSSQCEKYSAETCFTLAELASNISHLDKDNVVLSFLPGVHLLTRRLTISRPNQNIILTGQNSSNSLTTIKRQGTSGFEFRDVHSLNISYLEFTGCGNVSLGGAILISTVVHVAIKYCHFIDNHVLSPLLDSKGGAICAENILITMKFESNYFHNNSAIGNGGAISLTNSYISSINNHYTNNYGVNGGAIYVNNSYISSTSDHYINNTAFFYGGAINADSLSKIYSTNDYYINNSVILHGGGAIYSSGRYGCISSTNDYYIINRAPNGGAIYVSFSCVSSRNNSYINNSVSIGGGAIYVYNGNISSTSNHYTNNKARTEGGAIYVKSGDCSFCARGDDKISGDLFEENLALRGAAIYNTGGRLEIGRSNITNNYADKKGVVYLNGVSLSFSGGVDFTNNWGSLWVFNTQIEFRGNNSFVSNLGDSEGAIAIVSQISIDKASTVSIRNNTATNGGGISLTQSRMYVHHSIELTDNHAANCGGGIYAYQSEIDFGQIQAFEISPQRSVISKNAASNGGAICAIASNVQMSNTYVGLISNIARVSGGAIYLEQNSKIYITKNQAEDTALLCLKSRSVLLDFTNNSAEKGALYIADDTNDKVICEGASIETYQTECFIQTLSVYKYINRQNFINIIFQNNTAHRSGSEIYGGLLDRCTINPSAELPLYYNLKYLNGFDYIKATTQIEQIADYTPQIRHTDYISYLVHFITRSDVKGLISSDAVRVEFCLNSVIHPNHTHPTISIKKGEMFTVSLVAVDQEGNLLNATIITSFSSESGNGHIKDDQVVQQVGTQCTELEYNVYSQDSSAQLHIHADGPCSDIGVSRKTLYLNFVPCTCPVGFQPVPSDNDCICECDQRLKQHQITSCFVQNETILVESNTWIGLSNYTNETGFVIHDCPFDYCVQVPLYISLSTTESTDKKCAYNRTESLCGMCKEDLSLVFGSSSCEECSDYYIFLLLPFALAGIALVAFILLLNMTVATGTIHGMIFYANILTADHSLFLPFATPNFLTVFISWLNLDLGIETCFYDGMDSYGKFLLQLAFPTYVFVLIGTIIVLCEVSTKFAKLIGNRNPVAALCTFILLSYSKLIRTIITALQFTHLDYPDGSREIVWLYDGNVQYFTVSHIPRFIAAFIIIILGAIYTTLLFFGQWFPRCSNRKFMKWTRNTKYIAFIDAYHAPFTPKHRYWMGLLLLAQLTHNIVAAMTTDSPVTILSTGCVAIGLILLKLLNTRIYKNRLQDSLETLFLTNIVVLAIATYYTRETNENQLALANTSMAISFTLFLVIFGYHFYKYILKGTRVWARVTKQLQQIVRHRDRHRQFDVVPLEEDNEQDEQMVEMQPPYTDDKDTDPNDLPHDYDPPVIVPAVRYDQLREPALDIIDPITSDDYRQLNQPPAPRPRQVPTTTVIDFVRPCHNDHP